MYTHTYQIVQRRAQAHPDSVALGAQAGLGWETYTGQQLFDLTNRLATELANEGVSEGDRVVLWVPNRHWTAAYLFACWKLGAIVVPFDREMNPEAAADIITSVEPRLVLVGYGERPAWARDRAIAEWWEPGSRGGDPSDPNADLPREELAAIFFTSGTTGNPKGCMISHANFCHQVTELPGVIPLDPDSRMASILPLSHLFEMTCGLLYPLSCGSAIHYIPSRRAPDILRVLNEQRITSMIAVPQLLTMVGKSIDSQLQAQIPRPLYKLMIAAAGRLPRGARRRLFAPVHKKLGGHLTIFGSGGAALPLETLHLWERFGVQVAQGYGASECSPVIASTSIGGQEPAGSCGRPIGGVEVRLSPEGEAMVRGANVMRGYWRDSARTADVLKDGWYYSGDLATIDAGGNIFITGRAKDLIVLPSGMKVWPTDVEDVLCEHPAVKDAAVLMVATAGGGATLHAYLIAKPGQESTDINTIVAASNGRLAQHQRLATASWWQEADFPRTSTLKVRRMLLPQPSAATSVTFDSVMAADDPVAMAVAGIAKVPSVRDEQTLAELGLDSLGLVDLALALEEKAGKAISDGDLKLDMSVSAVREMVKAAPVLADGSSHRAGRNAQGVAVEQPLWPYTTGRHFRFVGAPFDGLYRAAVTKTMVEGGEHLVNLPNRLIFAGTHHSFSDFPLVRYGLKKTPARHLADRLVVAAWAGGFNLAGPLGAYAQVAFGLYPLHQDGNRDASLRGLVKLAEAGNPILIFPQGFHATPQQEIDGDPAANFKVGVSHIADALNATVVPFGVAGSEKVVPPDPEKHTGLKIAGIPVAITRGPLAIVFGAPVRMEPSESATAFAARLQAICLPLTRRAETTLVDQQVSV